MKSPNLILHCGATEVARTDLNKIIVPSATDTWHPVGHEPLLNLVEDHMANVGFRFGTQAHSLTKEGKRYFGLIHLLSDRTKEEDDYAMVMGIRNSIDKSFPASLVFGSQVFVCDNLAFSGEIKVTRKHTKNIWRDLPGLVSVAVARTAYMQANQEERFAAYKETKITKFRADHLIIDMLRRNVVNTSRIQAVVNEWDKPSHDFGDLTAWRLFNATTEALKGAPLHDMPTRTMALQALLDEVTGYDAPPLPQLEDDSEGTVEMGGRVIAGQAERLAA